MDTFGRPDPRPPPLSPALARAVAATRPVRMRRPARALAGVVAASLAYAAAIATQLGVRADLAAMPMFPFVVYAAACLASFLALLRAVLVPPREQVLPAGPAASRAAAVILAVLLALDVLVAVTSPGAHLALPPGGWARVLVVGVPCLLTALGVVSLPTGLGFFALRRLMPLGGWRIALALGAAAGALAGLVLHVHCPMNDPAHVIGVHGAAVLAPGLALAAVFGARSLSSRAKVDKREQGTGHGT
ncbi:MAG TPA: NrsF family protein [Polyangia bacterium]|nr:NrsF family protein [Polyangia bacterium]